MNRTSFLYTVMLMVICASIAAAITAVSAAVVEYAYRVTQIRSVQNMEGIPGIEKPYLAALAIQSIDIENKIIIANTVSPFLNQEIRVKLVFDADLRVQRSNAIVENGVFIGSSPKVDIALEDLREGDRGLGVLQNISGSSIKLLNFLVGNPFPRP